MSDKLKAFVKYLTDKGIPVILLTDPISKLPSITFSMLVVSFVIVVTGLIGKFSSKLDINLTESLTFFGITSSLYFAHHLGGSDRKNSKDESDT